MACKGRQANENELFSVYFKKQLRVSLKRTVHENFYKVTDKKLSKNFENSNSEELTGTPNKNLDCDERNEYNCTYPGCNKKFGKPSRLTVHIRTHTGERPFQCVFENCSKSYTRQFHLTRHLAVSHGFDQEVCKDNFGCDKCEKNFTNPYSLKKHVSRFHNEERYKCKECNQIFKKQQHLKTHFFVHTGIKPYKCNFPGCCSRFKVPSKLKRHSLSHLPERYLCPYETCQVKFDCYSDLRDHLTSSHPKKCDVCGKEFSMLCRLKEHLKSHQDLREAYFCPVAPCERYYFEVKNLRNHVYVTHGKNFSGFPCPLCSKLLITKQKLKMHMKLHSPNLGKVEKKKRNKPRKPRNDKGVLKTDFAKLLSGYTANKEKGLENEPSCKMSNDYDKSSL